MSILLYIDPGSGSFIFQMLMAGFLALAFYFRLIRDTVKAWIYGKPTSEEEGE